MLIDLQSYLRNIPEEVNFEDIQDFERLEERFFEVERYFGDIVGMGLGFVEFCPNQNPPDLKEEVLPWLWIIHPELKNELIKMADEKLNIIIHEYESKRSLD